jgi:protein-L-isoaspartate(D-aspartate) O-methyltransferase
MRTPWRIAILLALVAASAHAQRQDPYRARRLAMVEQYVAREGIQHPEVLEAMRITPRHEFLPRDKRRLAYFDMALPIGHGQTISPPYIVAFMTEALDPRPEDRVLEIGTGSGYQAAVLSPLVQDVYTIEIVRPLGQQAAKTFRRLGYANIHPRIGDGFAGWAEHAPFDKIMVTCSPENIPPALVEQLAEGGRMVIPVGERFQQTLCRFTKVNQQLQREPLQATFFVPMTGTAEEQRQVRPDLQRPELAHGSFESTQEESDQPAGWYYVREGRVTDDPEAPDGQSVVTFTNNVSGRSAHALQAFGVDGRKVRRLELSFWVRARDIRQGSRLDQRAQLLLEFYGEDRGPVGRVTIGRWLGSFSWRSQTERVPVPAAARLAVVGIGLFGATGEAAFDAVAVEPVSDP